MFVTSANHRYFEMQVPGTGVGEVPPQVLYIEPPKLKTLRRLEAIDQNGTVDEVVEIIAKIVGKNREGFPVDGDTVAEWWDLDEMVEFLQAFMNWMRQTRATDPN